MLTWLPVSSRFLETTRQHPMKTEVEKCNESCNNNNLIFSKNMKLIYSKNKLRMFLCFMH